MPLPYRPGQHWKDLADKQECIRLPIYHDRGTDHALVKEKVFITTNHFLANIPEIPPVLYNYDVKVTPVVKMVKGSKSRPVKPLSKDLKTKILRYACKQINSKKARIGLFTDFNDVAWSTRRIEELTDNQLQFEFTAAEIPEVEGSGSFLVTFQATAGNIDTSGLSQILRNLRQSLLDTPEEKDRVSAISAAYNIMLKNLGEGRYLPLGKSALIKLPGSDGTYLGDGLINWPGLSVSYNFGWKPFVNIDSTSILIFLDSYFHIP